MAVHYEEEVMKIFWTIFIMFIFSFSKNYAQESADFKSTDYLRFHIPVFTNQNLAIKLDVYDNKDLKGKPVYIIDNNHFTDLRNGTKTYSYKDFYKTSAEIVDDKPAFIINKKFPFNFVKISPRGYVLPIESKEGDVFKILEESLYFRVKLTDSDLNNFMEWRRDASLKGVRNLAENDKVFGKFMNDFSLCVKEKNVECLFSLNANIKEGVIFWNGLYKDANCKDDPEVKRLTSLKGKYLVNWELLKEFIDLKSSKISSELMVTNFAKEKRLVLKLQGSDVCGATSHVRLEYFKEENKAPLFLVEIRPVGDAN